jgi:uncharacterized protein (TIGR03086 family)
MTAPSPSPQAVSSKAVADRYRRVSTHFSAVVDAVPPDAWSAISPCEGWTARDIVDHVAKTESDMFQRMPFAPETADDLTDPLVAWPIVRNRVQHAVDNPETAMHAYDGFFGPTTFAETVDRFYCFDLSVHAWDLARAAGLSALEPIEVSEMDKIRADMAGLGDTMRHPGVIGPALEPPAGADSQTAFLAYLGRRAWA